MKLSKSVLAAALLAAGLSGGASAAGCPGKDGWVFADVEDTDPFCAQITWLARKNVTLGCAVLDGNTAQRLYCPATPTSRHTMAAFLERLAQAVQPLDCATGSVMQWNGSDWACSLVVGTQGPQGIPGPQGPVGAQGDAGPAGPVGPQGGVGPAGPAGAPGANGAAGVAGPQGEAGATGAPGADGKSVRSGAVPPDAAVGVDGDIYVDTALNVLYGPKAAGAWPPGVSLVGPAGPAGVQGPAGAPGEAGVPGPQGSVGAQGPAGPAGPQGPQGEAGPAGPQGSVGAQGPAGPAGPQGEVGPAGPQGAAGVTSLAGLVTIIEVESDSANVEGADITEAACGGLFPILIGGGCEAPSMEIAQSFPAMAGNKWVCRWTAAVVSAKTRAICAR